MRFGVIGASGFIGSHTMERLADRGLDAVGMDYTLSAYAAEAIDVRWPAAALAFAFDDLDLTHVINVAGLLGTSELFDNVEEAINVNIKGQYNVARACLERNIPLVTIEQPHIWTNPYETTRGSGVRLARGLAAHRGLRLATVTTYNAFGEGQGYGGHHPRKFVPTFSVNAWNGLPLEIYGDGEQRVNAVYAGDIAEVLIDACKHASPQVPEFLGAAMGGNFTVNQIAHKVLDVVGGGTIVYTDMRDGETDDGYGAECPNSMIYSRNEAVHAPTWDAHKFRATVNSYRGVKPDDIFP